MRTIKSIAKVRRSFRESILRSSTRALELSDLIDRTPDLAPHEDVIASAELDLRRMIKLLEGAHARLITQMASRGSIEEREYYRNAVAEENSYTLSKESGKRYRKRFKSKRSRGAM